jgi:hypothetical protein
MVDLLANEAMRGTRLGGAGAGPVRLHPDAAEPLTERHALRWSEIADRAIRLVEPDVLPDVPEQHRQRLTKHLASGMLPTGCCARDLRPSGFWRT